MSPEVYRERGMRFFFFSNERDEPPHVHVRKGASLAKVWLAPPGISYAMGFSPADLRRIRYIVESRATEFLEAWHEHHRPSG